MCCLWEPCSEASRALDGSRLIEWRIFWNTDITSPQWLTTEEDDHDKKGKIQSYPYLSVLTGLFADVMRCFVFG